MSCTPKSGNALKQGALDTVAGLLASVIRTGSQLV